MIGEKADPRGIRIFFGIVPNEVPRRVSKILMVTGDDDDETNSIEWNGAHYAIEPPPMRICKFMMKG